MNYVGQTIVGRDTSSDVSIKKKGKFKKKMENKTNFRRNTDKVISFQ